MSKTSPTFCRFTHNTAEDLDQHLSGFGFNLSANEPGNRGCWDAGLPNACLVEFPSSWNQSSSRSIINSLSDIFVVDHSDSTGGLVRTANFPCKLQVNNLSRDQSQNFTVIRARRHPLVTNQLYSCALLANCFRH